MTEFAPTPIAEIAVQPSVAAAPTAESAASPMAEPVAEVPLAYARSANLQHRFRTDDGKRVQVGFSVSYSALPDDQPAAARSVRENWEAAAASVRAICEAADLFDEDGRMACEDRLRDKLTDVLFSANGATRIGTVERVIWEQLTWK